MNLGSGPGTKAELLAAKYLEKFKTSLEGGDTEDYFEKVLGVLIFAKLVAYNFVDSFDNKDEDEDKNTDPDVGIDALNGINALADLVSVQVYKNNKEHQEPEIDVNIKDLN